MTKMGINNVLTKMGIYNLLHLAGQLAPIHKLNLVSGAALQMQRELQWFQVNIFLYIYIKEVLLFSIYSFDIIKTIGSGEFCETKVQGTEKQ